MRLSHLAATVATLAVCGCGTQSMAPVTGKVVFNGKPVKDAAVTFSPVGVPGQRETGKPGTGYTDQQGNFSLSTFQNYDGALVGSHSVHVTLDDHNPARCNRTKALALEVKPIGNEFTIEMEPK